MSSCNCAARRHTLLVAALALAAPAFGAVEPETLSHGRFEQVELYRPQGDARQVVLLLYDGTGSSGGMHGLAEMLAGEGALVIGVDLPPFLADLGDDPDECVNPDGDLENLAHFVEAYYELPTYRAPVLVGAGPGGEFAYAMLAKAQAGIFAGALSLGFCPRRVLHKALCPRDSGQGAKGGHAADGVLEPATDLQAPWIVVQAGEGAGCATDETHAFVARVPGAELVQLPAGLDDAERLARVRAAYGKLSRAPAPVLPAVPSDLSDLPIVEVAAHGSVDALAVFISGDGGWAGLDERVAASIAARGIPVVGLDSLRYFWKARTPASAAADIDRALRYYLAHWKKQRALLVGYSQGANVLPFIVNRLPQATRQKLARVALLGPGQTASFEFHLSNWISKDTTGLPIRPEAEKLAGVETLCLYGADEGDSLCPQLAGTPIQPVKLSGGHHFGGDYEGLAALIVRGIAP